MGVNPIKRIIEYGFLPKIALTPGLSPNGRGMTEGRGERRRDDVANRVYSSYP